MQSVKDHVQALQDNVQDVQSNVQVLHDQVQNMEGRPDQVSSLSQASNDDMIHGPQWIAGLPQENYTVQIAYVADRDGLYKLAQQYDYLLKDSLSYFSVSDNGKTGYVLLSGNYSSQQKANAALDKLPRYINQQRPVVRKLEAVQQYIAAD
jgi:septal ring-binding cell division protein DamX